MKRRGHAWLCAALGPTAWAAGALVDERLHLGMSHWLTLCRQSPGLLQALHLQLALLPAATVALLWALLLGTLGVMRHPHAAPPMLAAHGSCAVTMLLMPALCAALFGAWGSPAAAIAAMWLLEVVLATGIAAAALAMGKYAWHGSRSSVSIHP